MLQIDKEHKTDAANGTKINEIEDAKKNQVSGAGMNKEQRPMIEVENFKTQP